MKVRIQKWGNSLALRLPKSFATEVGIVRDSVVELSLSGGDLIVSPVAPASLTLEQLLSGATPENLHGEVESGPAQGAEVW